MAVDPRPGRHQARPVARLDLVELRVVDHPGEDLPRVERAREVGADDAEQVLGVVAGWQRRTGGRAPLAPVQPRDDPPADPQRVPFVSGDEIGQAAHPPVHGRAAQLLLVGHLAGGHADQRRPAEEDLRAAVDHHDGVAHAGHVGAAGGGVAEDQGDGRDTGRGQPGQVAEDLAAGDEDVLLGGQVRPAGLDEVDQRQPVLPRDLHRPQRLLQRPRVAGAAADRGVVGDQHALDVLDDADAGDDTGADGEVAAPGRQGRQLEERAVRVDQQLDPLAGQQLAALPMPGDRLLAATGQGLRVLGVQRLQRREHRLAVRRELRRPGVEGRAERAHRTSSPALVGPVRRRCCAPVRTRELVRQQLLRDVEGAAAQPFADGLALGVEAGARRDPAPEQAVDDDVHGPQVGQRVHGDGQVDRLGQQFADPLRRQRRGQPGRRRVRAGPQPDVRRPALVPAPRPRDRTERRPPGRSADSRALLRRCEQSTTVRRRWCHRRRDVHAGSVGQDGDVRDGVLRHVRGGVDAERRAVAGRRGQVEPGVAGQRHLDRRRR